MDDKKDPKRPAAGARRLLRMAGMTASLAGRYAGHAVANRFRDEAERAAAQASLNARSGAQLAQTLGELKGAVMKLGQLASQVADILPTEIAAPLKQLQNAAPPMPFSVIEDQLEQAFELPLDEIFAAIDPTPLAAASIGQVHAATMHDGREVVVKVQYPGVAKSCDSDLRQLRRALTMARLVKVDKAVLDGVFREIRDRLHEELDYQQEADNLRQFGAFFAADAHYIIPQPIAERSGATVLTLSREPGDSLEHAAQHYPLAIREQLMCRLFTFMSRSLFELHAIHADPNPANFAFRPDGRLVIYDFGCVKRLSAIRVSTYRDLISAALDQRWSDVDAGLHQLGARTPGSGPVSEAFYAGWQAIVLKPFLGDQPFDFSTSTIHKAVLGKSSELLEYMDRFQPAADTLYLDRMVSGHYWTLLQLGGQPALRPLLLRHLTLISN